MILPSRLGARLPVRRWWSVLGILAPIGMLAISGVMLVDLRSEAWERTEQASRNLLLMIESDVQRSIALLDLSLQAVIDDVETPGAAETNPIRRQLAAFRRIATVKDASNMLVLDATGDLLFDARDTQAHTFNFGDRDYFTVHRASADVGLYVSRPFVGRMIGADMIAISRRIARPDGSFAGVAVATLRLAFFGTLLDRVGLGPGGAVDLLRLDGTRIVRHPFVRGDIGVDLSDSPVYGRFLRDRTGSVVGLSPRDGTPQHAVFTRIGTLPLILSVGLDADAVEAAWRTKAIGIGTTLLALCGLTMALALLFGRELHRRATAEAELSRLSLTDSLTGLPNRRSFDAALAQAWDGARLARRPLALLLVDADHFKRINDGHGHAVGDAVLRDIGRCLGASIRHPGDRVARIGGEEFAVVLPDTDAQGAERVAARIHAEIAGLAIREAGINAGSVTVSIGVAGSDALPLGRASDLYRLADAGLYDAKAAGRNRTRGRSPDGDAAPRPRLVERTA